MGPGDVVADRFEIGSLAAQGEVAWVYRARDRKTGEDVALKVLPTPSESHAARFRREARVLSDLRHPGIVHFVDHGALESEGLYLAMEWIEGVTLEALLGRRVLTADETIALASSVAGALGAAHARGVVHRDIKPSNLLLCDGRVDRAKILDFGIARTDADDDALAREGLVLGTAGYLAPEQARGAARVDARADVHALGAVMFRCLTGRAPFVGHDADAVLVKVQREEAPRLSALRPGLPAALEALVARMLAKDPEARPADGSRVEDELAALAPVAPPARRPAPEPVGTFLGRPIPCVGREAELAALAGALDECIGEPVALAMLVTGEAGIGKSHLRHELVATAHARFPALEVWTAGRRGVGGGSSFGLLADLLREAAGLRDGDPIDERRRKIEERVERHVAEPDRARVAAFLGELVGAPFPEGSAVPLAAARRDPTTLGDQMRRAAEDFLAAECRAHPLVVVLEDLQWGDLPTVSFLDVALGNLRAQPLFVLALGRPEVDDLFPDLWRARRVRRVRLEELTRDASERLVRAAVGDEVQASVVDRIVKTGAGHPFLLEELSRAANEGAVEAPASVLAIVAARLERLPPEARRVLGAASVFGQSFWTGGVRALLDDDLVVDVEKSIDDLAVREIILPRPQSRFVAEREWVFRHALVREAAHASQSDEDRSRGHRLAGKWLERIGERDPVTLAEHFERGGERSRAARSHRDAAFEALQGNDFAAVLSRGARARECGATGTLLGDVRMLDAEAHRWRVEQHESLGAALEATALLPVGSALWCHAAASVAVAAMHLGRREALLAIADAISDCALDGGATAEIALAAARAATALLFAGDTARAEALIDRLTTTARPGALEDPVAEPRWLGLRAYRAYYAGDPAGTVTLMQAAIESAERAGDLRVACITGIELGGVLAALGAYERGEALLRRALATAQRMAIATSIAFAQQALGHVLAARGALDEALATSSAALAAYDAQDSPRLAGGARCHVAVVRWLRGELDLAEEEAIRAVAALEVAPPLCVWAKAVLARVRLDRGDAHAALETAREAMALLERLGEVERGEWHARLVYSETLFAVGERAAAHGALAVAHDRLLAAATAVREPGLRESFLSRVRESARIVELASSWLGRSRRLV